MEQVTQRSAANSEESAAASEELAAQAQGLYAIVERLRGMVGGSPGKETVAGSLLTPTGKVSTKSSSADLKVLRSALRNRGIEATAPAMVQNRDSFPLDDRDNDF
jgi:methyl-accepting chemotaxis protein